MCKTLHGIMQNTQIRAHKIKKKQKKNKTILSFKN